MKDCKFVRKFNIRILRESLKETRICDSQYPWGKCLAPAVKIPYRRPWHIGCKRSARACNETRRGCNCTQCTRLATGLPVSSFHSNDQVNTPRDFLKGSARAEMFINSREWNGLDQSAGFIIQSSPGGFGLDWIRNSPTQRILDWTGFRNVQFVSHI